MNFECCQQCGLLLHSSEVQKQLCTNCVIKPPYFDATCCLDRYEGRLQAALHLLKYQKRVANAHGLAYAWNAILSPHLQEQYADCLLPVPLSHEKLKIRGFNQSWELARRVESRKTIQKLPYALRRHHNIGQQAGSTLIGRHDSIQNMFFIDTKYLDFLKDKTVVVFDDVMTSGATLNEIARILKESDVKRVINWVLLRTTKQI
ncbi:ComF family protein [Polynucleobacter asymbioticus]|uniref:ComF family protein n=1 Tax=Polynucleobacter asymbioticus TaxID=576611 RepID=UPI00191BA1A1|nr:phosphoribosyltransferase family protein [Polynucleobacter asymbioticus]